MRIDLAVDIPDVPVAWFKQNTVVAWKRFLSQTGEPEQAKERAMGMGCLQTLEFGRRPNLIRIYDKLAEYRHQYGKLPRRVSADQERPTFEETFGVKDEGTITRAERQYRGNRIPEQLRTLRNVQRHLLTFDPFDSLSFAANGVPEPEMHRYDFDTFCAGMWLRHIIHTEGIQAAERFIRKGSNGQAARTKRRFADFLASPDEQICFTKPVLTGKFRESCKRQMRFLEPYRLTENYRFQTGTAIREVTI